VAITYRLCALMFLALAISTVTDLFSHAAGGAGSNPLPLASSLLPSSST